MARRPKRSRPEVRSALGLGTGPLVLLSFGGLGLPGFAGGVLAGLDGFHFLWVGDPEAGPRNVTTVPGERLDALGLGYEDLVAGADVVVTKPGYGIVSDAIAARTRVVYTERGDFLEYEVLVEGMARHLPCVHVSNEDLRAGKLGGALLAVLQLPFPPPPDLSGAAVAARRVLEVAAGGG